MTHHHHHHETKSTLSFEEQLLTLFGHWISHNESHAKTYLEWADKAKEKKMSDISSLLEEVAELTGQINSKIKIAQDKVSK